LLSFIIIGPLAFLPNILLANLLFDDPATTLDLIVRPLPLWAFYAAAVLFPLTQGLAEIPLYFGYVMPRLDARPFPDLRPVILPALMLGFQHLAVPLLFNLPFILWRALMYIPFAFGIGLLLHWRPRLMPYIVVIHVLMDFSFILMFLPAVY
jgi:membrane protease YdiL (CAAX protease family)